MANLKASLELDNQAYLRGIKAADSATNAFARDATLALNKIEQGLTQLNRRSAALSDGFGRLKSAISGVAIGSFIANAAMGADAILDLSDATDLSVSKLMEFKEALQLAGGSGDDAAKAITTFFSTVDQANTGTDKAINQFAKLGVTFEDLRTLSESDLLDKTIKGFENITDPIARANALTDIFGKSMRTVSPDRLGQELVNLRGTMEAQAAAAEASGAAIERFEKFINNLKAAVLIVLDPLLKITGATEGSASSAEKLAEAIKILVTAYVALKATLMANVILQATLNALQAAGAAKSPLAKGIVGLASLTAGYAVYEGLKDILKDVENQANATNSALTTGTNPAGTSGPRNRPQEIGKAAAAATLAASKELAKTSEKLAKELQDQLNSVQGLADGYRRAAQVNMDRMTTEMDILNLTKEQAEVVKGTAEINSRYADQVSALEDKRKGAKAETLEQIDKEIENLEDLRTSELDIFNITREKTREYARQQQEIKNIVEQMEQQAEYAREIAEFQNQQGQAVLAAFEQVRAQREALELTGQREALEKSIQNLRGSEQATIRELFDLENERKKQLEAIQKIQNLPFEGQGGMKQRLQEINDLYDARKLKIEETAAATKAEQDSFATGWSNAGEKFRNNIKTDAEYAAQQLSNFTKGFEDAFVKFVQTGKLSFKDLANSMIADFARIQAQRLLTSFMGGGGGGGFFGSIGKIFGFANGGMPPVGQPSLVGERGPELFVPQNAGKIIPNHKLGLGGQSVINNTTEVSYNIQAVDAASFQQLVASDPKFLHAVVEKGRRSLPQGGRR